MCLRFQCLGQYTDQSHTCQPLTTYATQATENLSASPAQCRDLLLGRLLNSGKLACRMWSKAYAGQTSQMEIGWLFVGGYR